jgi:hypothetical protein
MQLGVEELNHAYLGDGVVDLRLHDGDEAILICDGKDDGRLVDADYFHELTSMNQDILAFGCINKPCGRSAIVEEAVMNLSVAIISKQEAVSHSMRMFWWFCVFIGSSGLAWLARRRVFVR